ncbi:MAG: hypothetical protein JXR39_07765 [Marinilabiliaceae bacterium]|nr:hypothetical protein [Marinilabiliaceae bacterium]
MATHIATFNILIHTHDDKATDEGLLFRSIKTLSDKGVINGMKPLSLVNGQDYWSLFYTCDCTKSSIEAMLSPIHQDFFIHKLSDGNLFEVIEDAGSE